MKASELKSCIERIILQYGDLEIMFKDEYKNKTNLSAYIYNISQYVGGGIPAEIKVIDDIEK